MVDSLRANLVSFAGTAGYGVNFHPFDILLIHHQIPLQAWDFVFLLCDSFEYLESCDLVLYPKGYPTNGREHHLSFEERMMVIQQIAEIALNYSNEVELFLSDDNPHLPDFVDLNIPCKAVASTLCQQYRQHTEINYPFEIPSVHMKIRSTEESTGDGFA